MSNYEIGPQPDIQPTAFLMWDRIKTAEPDTIGNYAAEIQIARAAWKAAGVLLCAVGVGIMAKNALSRDK